MSSTPKPTLSHHTDEDLPPAHSLREAANTDNTLEGYAALNAVQPQSEIAQAALAYPVDLHQQISELAYRMYLERGGADGSAEDDWYRAEQSIRHSHER